MWGRAEEGEGPASLSYSLLSQEGMLRDLQKSVEEEEQVWKAKVGATEEELQKVSQHVHLPRAWWHGHCCWAAGSQMYSTKDTRLG